MFTSIRADVPYPKWNGACQHGSISHRCGMMQELTRASGEVLACPSM